MSIEMVITLEHGNCDAIRKLLISLGYQKNSINFMYSKNDKLLHFHWFDAQDYRSTDGVEATLIPVEIGGKTSTWMVHTRTRIWASFFDLQKQDETIRLLRKEFGGNFTNDHAGTNRYINPTRDSRLPVGRGIYAVYSHVSERIRATLYALPEPVFKNVQDKDANNALSMVIAQADPSRVIYNALVAFCVASLESFFSEAFVIMLRYDKNTRKKIQEQGKKIEMSDVVTLLDGNLTIERLIANQYSFQNVDAIQKSFKEWLNINLSSSLDAKKKISGRTKTLRQHYLELIERRHDFIHRFEIDTDLDQEKTRELLRLVKIIMDSCIDCIENQKGILIRDPNYYNFLLD